MVIFWLVILGLAFGSFINALVWRFHEQSQRKKPKPELSVLKGRSMCPSCKHTLAAKDLVPIISWLSLRGKCRYCKKPVSWQYPFVELLTATLYVLSYAFWPYGWGVAGISLFIGWLIVLVGLIALAVYDIKWMLLPNKIVFPLLGVWSLVLLVVAIASHDVNVIWSAVLGLVFCGGVFWVLFQFSDGRWIGGGDVKLGFLLGLIVGGPFPALMVIFLSSVLGTIAALPMIIKGSATTSSRIPYGPFLITRCNIRFFGG
jgi:prepilin signal peptidase PulO-like enzyme (type II secretory pathway)